MGRENHCRGPLSLLLAWEDHANPPYVLKRQRRAAAFEARMDHRTPNDASAVEQSGSRNRRRAATRAPQAHSLPTLIAPDVEAEALLRSTLDALSAHIAVLDEAGTIIAVNQAWRAFAHVTRCVRDSVRAVG